MHQAQLLAAGAVSRVLAGHSLTQALPELVARQPGLSAQQRAAAQDLSYGSMRFYGLLRAVLRRLVPKPLKDDTVRCLLLVALYQLAFTNASAHAVVDNAVRAAEAGKPWAKGLVNAVLRNFLRNRETLLQEAASSDEEARYSHPAWWIAKLRAQHPTSWEAILEADNQRPPMTLRVNRRATTVAAYQDLLRRHGMDARPVGAAALLLDKPVPVSRLPGFAEGLVSVQDAGAQLAVPLLEAQPGMRVLDACAAPGGKTAHLLEWADVAVTALDSDATRLEKVRENLARLHLTAECLQGDATKPETWWDRRLFQRILADVPCSASGVVRRHPDIKWLRRESDIAQFAAVQREILEALWRVLDGDGKLLYVTCSIFAEENQQQIAAFLERHPEAKHLPLPPAGEGEAVAPGERMDGQLLPSDTHDGFFFALLQKS